MRADAKFRMCILGGLCLAGSVAAAPAARGPVTPTMDSEFRAAYPMTTPAAAPQLAGVALARLVIPGLQLSERSERAPEDGGIVISLADGEGVVRVLVHLAVAADAAAARRVLDAELHGVATQLAPASDQSLGELAWADEAGKGTALVIAAQANIAYSVSVAGAGAPGVPTAAAIAGLLRKAMVVGRPVFPAATVALASAIDARTGGAVHITVPEGYSYKLRADGGYLARGENGPVVRPFGPGAVTVYATVTDELARVTVVSGTTIAK